MTLGEVAAYNRDLAARITEASRRAWEESLAGQKPQRALETLLKWANAPEDYNPADDDFRRGFTTGRQSAKGTVLSILREAAGAQGKEDCKVD